MANIATIFELGKARKTPRTPKGIESNAAKAIRKIRFDNASSCCAFFSFHIACRELTRE